MKGNQHVLNNKQLKFFVRVLLLHNSMNLKSLISMRQKNWHSNSCKKSTIGDKQNRWTCFAFFSRFSQQLSNFHRWTNSWKAFFLQLNLTSSSNKILIFFPFKLHNHRLRTLIIIKTLEKLVNEAVCIHNTTFQTFCHVTVQWLDNINSFIKFPSSLFSTAAFKVISIIIIGDSLSLLTFLYIHKASSNFFFFTKGNFYFIIYDHLFIEK